MSNDFTDLTELSLRTSPSNLKASLKLRAMQPGLEKREELEQLFTDAKHEYDVASDDVRIRGSVINVEKFTSKGHTYTQEIVNPSFRVMTKLSQQLAVLAKMLSKFEKSKKASVIPGSFEDLFPDIAKERAS